MGWIAWIVVGAIAGFLASIIVGSRQGLLMMIVVGIVGGLIGGFVATNLLHIGSVDGFNVESILIATLGAAAVLVVMNQVTRPRGLNRLWRH
ncbi:MAG TPA: GlsB/YeaQ/YmgE family stress response membrane protein [Gemmatimonadales bacterium]|nr:GlsB/YeaQ/YmgE family stress response membrane protein [Gemmatimonadales bacterium]